MRIVFAGKIGRSITGGGAWTDLQYLLGLRELGHEVYYLEDCGETSWVYDWDKEEWTEELTYPAAYVRDCLQPFGFTEQWIYRTTGQAAGMALRAFEEICSQADLMIMRGIPLWVWRKEYEAVRRRIFIDVDPGFTQIDIINGDAGLRTALEHCHHLFTIGQRFGARDCRIPSAGLTWLKTLSPVALSAWPYAQDGPATHFTSVMRWQGLHEVTYEGTCYGQKDKEFPRFFELPRRTKQPFCLALNGPEEVFVQHGWEILPGEVISKTPLSYREFIQHSRAEFGVAKHGYVAMRSGWFSDRSVCYLASGRPILIQDTGLRDWLPAAEGLVLFQDVPEALHGIERINGDYEHHRRAARQLAEEYFATEKVLPPLLEAAMN